MSVKQVLILRHGQTANNAQLRIQGMQNTPLNDVGVAQAKFVAGELSSFGITRIISSDLDRAVNTAQAVADLVGLPVEHDSRLRERGYGSWEGMTSDEIKEAYPQGWARWRAGHEPAVAGVETRLSNGERVAEAMREYVQWAQDDSVEHTLLFVSHGSAIVNGVSVLMGMNPSESTMLQGPDNCHWAQLVVRPQSTPIMRVKSWNQWTNDAQAFQDLVR
ncbi:histidine phosphatase family protein [Arcanobacterium phocisimile]|uniref:Histidine phosphatase family protein n=1 Tax=Arcanobacterium phocisimile TaxID=1302235 RepID=A0ABX7IF10_9ACTO|nr:histidine phosphatase family protein [Arcanobacterium phocisimile]QRV01547.1 histidine phosphatase family protein [Arcanobacterium phocisimile]